VTTVREQVYISEDSAEACLAVFEAIPLLRNASVASELREALRRFDQRVGQCNGGCHERDEDDCPRCCSGRYLQICDDCRAAA
jgi:hypothetical protein